MAKKFKLPQLSEGVESATVAQIMVTKGDQVEEGQIVFELETEKASAEVPCDIEGTVSEIHVAEGDEAKVGQTMLTMEEEGQESAEQEEQEDKDKEKKGESDTEEAQPPKKDEDVAEQEDQSENAEEPQGQTEPGREEAEKESKAQEEAPADEKDAESSTTPVPAAPSVRRFARECGVDIESVEGSGPHGRISIEDVKAHASSQRGETGGGPSKAVEAQLPDFSNWGEIERKPLEKVRRLTAEQMVRSTDAIPQAVQFGKAEIGAIDQLHDKYQSMAEEAGGHLSLTVVLVKALAGALKRFPRFNASIDLAGDEMIYKHYIHIGIAMDTERGLVVPVLRDCNRKSIIELSVELKELTKKARAGKLQLDDMKGANMTISNAGALGGDLFIPIVSWLESAILGVAQSRTEAVFEDGSFNPKPMLPLSLAYDHRLNDGADSVRFLQWIIDSLENPLKMAVEG